MKEKMLLASFKDSVKKKLAGIAFEFGCSDIMEIHTLFLNMAEYYIKRYS